jgi:hypothetical protein
MPPGAERLAVRGASALARRVPLRGGGTPDPCHWDHPARPGVKLEPPQPLVGRLAVPVAGVAARRNELDAGVCRAGW